MYVLCALLRLLHHRYCDSRKPTGRPTTPGFVARSAIDPITIAKTHWDWLALFPPEAPAARL